MAAWERLRHGNDRFVAGRPEHPGQDTAKRRRSATGNDPLPSSSAAVTLGSPLRSSSIKDSGTCSWSGRLDT